MAQPEGSTEELPVSPVAQAADDDEGGLAVASTIT